MSNVPDDKRPQSDVADQLAGTPSADNDTTAADASPLTGDGAASSEQPEQPAEPMPLVEPTPEPPLEPSSDPVFASDAESDRGAAPEPTAAAEAAPLPEGVTGTTAHDSSSGTTAPAASAHPISDPVAEPAASATPAAVPVTQTEQQATPQTEQHAAPQTVYVTAPTPPKKRSNRGIGTLLAVLGTIAFALLHGMITAIAYVSAGRAFDVARFVGSTGFLVPTIVFLVVFVLAVLIINRAGWWAWVLGSLVVAAATYFLSIGIIMLLENVVAMTPAEAQFVWEQLALSAPMVIALVVAREVAVWFGLAIAARGKRVKARNIEAREAYDREVAENRARYGTTYA